MTIKEITELPVYLGNDDELNGIHTAWYVQPIDPDKEDDADFVELINEDHHNIEIKEKSILISCLDEHSCWLLYFLFVLLFL